MKIRKSVIIIPGIILLLVIMYLLSPLYIRRALIYLTPGIDDYHIFNNRTVASPTPIPWSKSSGYNTYEMNSRDEEVFKEFKSTALVVIHNDSLLYEKYWEGYSDTSRTNSFSVAKSIVGLLTGCAIDDGFIKNVDQPVYEILPEFGNTENDRKLTIRHLLTMSSGLDWDESYSSLFSTTTKAYYGNDIKNLVLGLHVIQTPGKVFEYMSCNTQLLALILNKVTGMPLSYYASKKLWQPMNAEFPAFWSLDKIAGNEKAYCCFNSTAKDFARIGSLILHKGNWNGRQLVPENYMNQFLSTASGLKNKSGKNVDFYCFQVWCTSYKGHQIHYARGILGQYIIVIPDKKIVIVRLGKKRSGKGSIHPPDMLHYVDFGLKLVK